VRRLFVLLVAGLTMSACVPQGEFPSLAMRPAERLISTEAPARPQPVVPSDPALRQRIAEFQRLAAEGARAFDATFGTTATAVGAAGGEASESWVEAQQAVSRLETTREPTTRALAELDRLAIGRANVPTNAADYAAVEAAIASVAVVAAGQQRRIDGLKSRLDR
jgi:hypothetical protein